MNKNQKVFESMSIPKAVATLAIPTMLSMLVTVIYNMADTYFVGQTGDANQVAAVSLAMPVFLLLMALGNIFGIGGSSFISRSLGEGKAEKVKHISSFCFWGSVVSGVVLGAVFIIFADGILPMVGASPNTFGYAKDYLITVALGAPFNVLSFAYGNILRGEGASRQAMTGMMLGTIVNIILDPVMILWWGWGVKGAAAATVIGNIAAAVYYIVYMLRKDTMLTFSPKHFKMNDGIFGGVFKIGIPAAINSALMSASNIILNVFLASYGDTAVAGMGVAMKANMLVAMIQIGLAAGIQPLIGYNYGAKNYRKMNKVIKFTLFCTVILGTVITAVYYFVAHNIINAFINDAAVIENGVMMLRALMISGPVMGILFVFMNSLQGMGKAVPSLVLSLSRQGLVFIPTLFIANAIAGLNGIVYAQPLADIASVIISTCMYIFIYRKLKHNEFQNVIQE